ncbi:MAG TPA: hypothetical protein VL172_10780, partial [Kofleriaceae bacterium]|nr:hypothetical protein [Kofleriaceae bacterium]
VDGVAGVSPVRLFEEDDDGRYLELPGAGKVVTTFDIEDWQLPELTALTVVEGVDAPASVSRAGEEGDGGNAPGSGTVFLPVVPELC